MENQHPTDKFLRDRLAELSPGEPRGWSALEQKMNLEDKTADARLAEKLTGLAPTLPPGSWEGLAAKLDRQQQTADSEVDDLVSQGLRQAAPVATSGWAQLAARLELVGKRREMVACLKLTESVLLLSLLLLFARSGGLPGDKGERPAAPTDSGPYAEQVIANPPTGSIPPAATRVNLPREDAPPVTSPPAGPVQSASVAPLPTGRPNAVVSERATFVPEVRNVIEMEPIVTVDYLTGLLGQRVVPALDYPLPAGSAPVNYSLNLFVSPLDLNPVKTLEDARYGVEGQWNLSTGYSLGALLDITQQQNTVQTGLIYGYRSYIPAEIFLIEGDQVVAEGDEPISYGKLRYRTLSAPLNYYRTVYADERWAISGGLGASINVILSAEGRLNENYTKADLERLWLDYLRRAREQGSVTGIGRGASDNDFLEPSEGLLEGGDILDNASLYVTGSLRVERRLNDRWSLYFAPTIGRLVTIREDDGGKGPFGDRIHNTMLRFGTRVRLTDR